MPAWFLRLLVLACTLIGSAFSTKLLTLGNSNIPASFLLLPFILILISLIQHLYGLKFSLRCLLIAILANLIFIAYGKIITLMPSPTFAINNELFDSILAQPFYLMIQNLLFLSGIPFLWVLFLAFFYKIKLIKHFKKEKKQIIRDSLLTQSKYLSILMVVYGVIILAANWYDPRFIKIFWFEVDSGTLVFPLTNIMLDIITEVYGYKNARLAIWCGFLFNVIILLMGQAVVRWHSANSVNFLAYQHFLLFDIRIIIASFVSYFATEGVSAYIIAKLKILFSGRLMAIRFVSSTFVGYLIDAVVFCIIAFAGLISMKALFTIMFTSCIMMAGIEMLLLPFTVIVAKKLKQIEKIDIYDQTTRFTLLSLDHHYTRAENKF